MAKRRFVPGRLFKGDKVLWIIIAFLAIASLLVVYSSTGAMAYRQAGGNTSHFLGKQLMFILAGAACVIVVHRIDYEVYAKYSKLLLVLGLGLMLMTFIFGVNLNDASRWLRIPIIGLTFQPSDFLKISLVMVLAGELAKRQGVIDKMPLLPSLRYSSWVKNRQKNVDIFMRTSLPILLPIALACFAILISNFSTAAIVFLVSLLMMFIGRVKIREIWRLIGLVVIVLVISLMAFKVAGVGRVDTWVNRITEFVSSDKQGDSSDDEDLQVREAKVAIAIGGLVGKGPGNSTQRSNLPHSYSDFAYAFIVEEYGFVGAAIILMLYLWIFFRAILILQKCDKAYPSLLVFGLSLMITLQAIINMAVSVHLMPVTGQTLPLISLGGSSIIFTSIAFGMILGVSRQTEEQENKTEQ